MNPPATQRETLEVFCYTLPKAALAFVWSAIIAAVVAIFIVYVYRVPFEPFTEWFRQWLGSRQIPVAVVLGIYGLAGIAIVKLTRDWLKVLASRPTVIAERSGLTTEWSQQLEWNDIDGFLRGTQVSSDRNPLGIQLRLQYVCAVIPNDRKYPLPWWVSGHIGLGRSDTSVMEPANAFPVTALVPDGYFVRRNGLEPMVQVDTHGLIAELDDFRTRIRDKGGQ